MDNESRPHPFWSPIGASLALLAPALLAWGCGHVLLFASLGPTAVMQAHEPRHRSSKPYSVIVAHLVGLACAFATVWLLRLSSTPSVFVVGSVSGARATAAVLSIFAGTVLELQLRAPHPPAASTTLLAALGSFHPTWIDTGLVIGGVVAVTAAGEAVRRLRTHPARPSPRTGNDRPPRSHL